MPGRHSTTNGAAGADAGSAAVDVGDSVVSWALLAAEVLLDVVDVDDVADEDEVGAGSGAESWPHAASARGPIINAVRRRRFMPQLCREIRRAGYRAEP